MLYRLLIFYVRNIFFSFLLELKTSIQIHHFFRSSKSRLSLSFASLFNATCAGALSKIFHFAFFMSSLLFQFFEFCQKFNLLTWYHFSIVSNWFTHPWSAPFARKILIILVKTFGFLKLGGGVTGWCGRQKKWTIYW